MKEIGGYFEINKFSGAMLHEAAIKLNSGRHAVAYLIELYGIKKILMPYFMCESCNEIFERYGVQKRYYHINETFVAENLDAESDEWIYIVDYYGQLEDQYILGLKKKYNKIIVDYSHNYFHMPIEGIDTLYSCRKYFGVPDGAVLYTEGKLNRDLEYDVSYERMKHVLGRFERTASDFYEDYRNSEETFQGCELKRMSKLTENLLRGIDYEDAKNKRTANYRYLFEALRSINRLNLCIPEGAFMYPLYLENGEAIRKALQKRKIYIPCLWPNVVEDAECSDLERSLARNILPLPVDQRYTKKDMQYLIDCLQCDE